MSQTSYTYGPVAAVAGQLFSRCEFFKIVSRPCGATAIPFGSVVVEAADGTVSLPSTATLGSVLGVAVKDQARESAIGGGSTGYKQGDMVPVLRQGTIWATYNGGTKVSLTGANVKHASTDGSGNAQYRGNITLTATNAVVGTEITKAPGMMVLDTSGPATLVKLEVNFPGNLV